MFQLPESDQGILLYGAQGQYDSFAHLDRQLLYRVIGHQFLFAGKLKNIFPGQFKLIENDGPYFAEPGMLGKPFRQGKKAFFHGHFAVVQQCFKIR